MHTMYIDIIILWSQYDAWGDQSKYDELYLESYVK